MIPSTFERLRLRLTARQPVPLLQPRTIEAAVALILVATLDGDLEVLFIQRAELTGDPWSGHMALPGGRRSPDDSDLLATAIREAREETGIELPRDYVLGQLDEFAPRTPTLPPVVVRPYVFGLPSRPPVTRAPKSRSTCGCRCPNYVVRPPPLIWT